MYITYKNALNIRDVVGRSEAVGYGDGGFSVFASTDRNPIYEQPDELLALGEPFGRVLFDLGDTFSERDELGVGCIGKLGALTPLG